MSWAYTGRVPQRLARGRITRFWEDQAEYIHNRWGTGDWDFEVLGSIIERHNVRSVLDVGCGSGRLFRLYKRYGLRVVGVDISTEALAIARSTHPDVPTRCGRIQDCLQPNDAFDLAISNRVLQHVPRQEIETVVDMLSSVARLVYINELSAGETTAEDFFMVKHDYEALFAAKNFRTIERGFLESERQMYVVFGAPETTNKARAA